MRGQEQAALERVPRAFQSGPHARGSEWWRLGWRAAASRAGDKPHLRVAIGIDPGSRRSPMPVRCAQLRGRVSQQPSCAPPRAMDVSRTMETRRPSLLQLGNCGQSEWRVPLNTARQTMRSALQRSQRDRERAGRHEDDWASIASSSEAVGGEAGSRRRCVASPCAGCGGSREVERVEQIGRARNSRG